MQTNLAFQIEDQKETFQAALIRLGERWPLGKEAAFSTSFMTQIPSVYSHLLSSWPEDVGPEESLALLSRDIAGQMRPMAERSGHDTFGLSLSSTTETSESELPLLLLYDLERGIRVPYSDSEALFAPERALWVGYAPLDEAEAERFLSLQKQREAEPPSEKILENLKVWQRSFFHALALAQADAAMSMEAQTSLLGLLKQGRSLRGAVMLAQSKTSSSHKGKIDVKAETQKMRAAIVKQLANGTLPEAVRAALRLSLKNLDKAMGESPIVWKAKGAKNAKTQPLNKQVLFATGKDMAPSKISATARSLKQQFTKFAKGITLQTRWQPIEKRVFLTAIQSAGKKSAPVIRVNKNQNVSIQNLLAASGAPTKKRPSVLPVSPSERVSIVKSIRGAAAASSPLSVKSVARRKQRDNFPLSREDISHNATPKQGQTRQQNVSTTSQIPTAPSETPVIQAKESRASPIVQREPPEPVVSSTPSQPDPLVRKPIISTVPQQHAPVSPGPIVSVASPQSEPVGFPVPAQSTKPVKSVPVSSGTPQPSDPLPKALPDCKPDPIQRQNPVKPDIASKSDPAERKNQVTPDANPELEPAKSTEPPRPDVDSKTNSAEPKEQQQQQPNPPIEQKLELPDFSHVDFGGLDLNKGEDPIQGIQNPRSEHNLAEPTTAEIKIATTLQDDVSKKFEAGLGCEHGPNCPCARAKKTASKNLTPD